MVSRQAETVGQTQQTGQRSCLTLVIIYLSSSNRFYNTVVSKAGPILCWVHSRGDKDISAFSPTQKHCDRSRDEVGSGPWSRGNKEAVGWSWTGVQLAAMLLLWQWDVYRLQAKSKPHSSAREELFSILTVQGLNMFIAKWVIRFAREK